MIQPFACGGWLVYTPKCYHTVLSNPSLPFSEALETHPAPHATGCGGLYRYWTRGPIRGRLYPGGPTDPACVTAGCVSPSTRMPADETAQIPSCRLRRRLASKELCCAVGLGALEPALRERSFGFKDWDFGWSGIFRELSILLRPSAGPCLRPSAAARRSADGF